MQNHFHLNVSELVERKPLFMEFDCDLVSCIASLTFTPKIHIEFSSFVWLTLLKPWS